MKIKYSLAVLVMTCTGVMGTAHAVDANDAPVAHAKAEAEAQKKASKQDRRVALAECKGLSGNDKDVCKKEADAAYEKEVASAKADVKSAKAEAKADIKANDAAYKAARERCDPLSGGAKDACIADAKAQFGK